MADIASAVVDRQELAEEEVEGSGTHVGPVAGGGGGLRGEVPALRSDTGSAFIERCSVVNITGCGVRRPGDVRNLRRVRS